MAGTWALLAVCLAVGCGEKPGAPPAPEAPPPAAAAPTGPVFVDRAVELGVDFHHVNGMTGGYYTAEVTASGCGVLDYDGDGDLDLYLPQGRVLQPGKGIADLLTPLPPESEPLRDRLYRNDLEVGPDGARRLAFTDVTEESGLDATGYAMGVATGDVDNDGDVDLYVANLGPNQLWINQGDGTFVDGTEAAGAGDDRWSVPVGFFDYDRDGWLDLMIGNYVDFRFDDEKTCFRVTGARDFCGPLAYAESPDRLLHNRGDGTFEDATRAAGLTMAFGSALGVVFADVDRDGWLDLYVANDQRPNQLWMNRGDGSFVDEALLRGAAVNAQGQAEASMGVEAADFDGDGSEDLFMAHLLGETNTIYANDGFGMYEDASVRTGLGAPSKWATAFGAAAIDFDNDGWIDVMTANGEVRIIEEQARNGVSYPLRQPNQLFRNEGGGRFVEATERAGEAFGRLEVSRGAAVGDLDNDGDHDLVVLNSNGPFEVLVNEVGQDLPWVGFAMRGADVPRDMLGTAVSLWTGDGRVLWRRVRTAGSFASARDPRVLFGLGTGGGAVRVRAAWPSGRTEEWDVVEVGRYATLVEGTGRPVEAP